MTSLVVSSRRFVIPAFGTRENREWAHSVARLWVPISSLLTHMVYLLPFWSYLAVPKSVCARPPDPDTMLIPLKKQQLRRAAKMQTLSKLVKPFIEKSRPEHDSKSTYLRDMRRTEVPTYVISSGNVKAYIIVNF